jgi:hypothetical protein
MMDSVRQTVIEFDARQERILNQQNPRLRHVGGGVDRIQIVNIIVSVAIYVGVIHFI